jgi:hypothetical protein
VPPHILNKIQPCVDENTNFQPDPKRREAALWDHRPKSVRGHVQLVVAEAMTTLMGARDARQAKQNEVVTIEAALVQLCQSVRNCQTAYPSQKGF